MAAELEDSVEELAQSKVVHYVLQVWLNSLDNLRSEVK